MKAGVAKKTRLSPVGFVGSWSDFWELLRRRRLVEGFANLSGSGSCDLPGMNGGTSATRVNSVVWLSISEAILFRKSYLFH